MVMLTFMYGCDDRIKKEMIRKMINVFLCIIVTVEGGAAKAVGEARSSQ
jgi:hypothetical protein